MDGIPKKYRLAPLRVMVVDDEITMLRLLKQMLARCGIRQVETAADGATALRRLRTFDADLILVDWQMNNMDGHEFLRMVRDGSVVKKDYGIFMITGNPQEDRVRAALTAGVDGFLAKPISTATLEQHIYRYIDLQRADLQRLCANPLYQKFAEASRAKGAPAAEDQLDLSRPLTEEEIDELLNG